MDIMTGEKLSSIKVAINWSVLVSSRRGGDVVKGLKVGWGEGHYFSELQI